MSIKKQWIISLGLMGALAGCGSGSGAVDAQTEADAATRADAASQTDASVDAKIEADAATEMDAGAVETDAATETDAGVVETDAATEPDMATGPATVTRTTYVLAGDDCAHGGDRIESGLDNNENGKLDDEEVDAGATQLQCRSLPAFEELDPLPAVTTVWGFALTASADDGSPRLGFMFTDPAYRTTVNDVLADLGGGVYDGANTYVTYQLTDSTWQPYEGRGTPQTYAYSELVVVDGASYYTTSYPPFGGLVAVIRDGGKGTYALTPATTTRKEHSIAVPPGSADVYALIAQKTPGLTFSRFPIDQFGVTFPNYWVNLATLDTASSTVSSPQLVVAGGKIAASYVQDGAAVVRATDDPAAVAAASDVPVIGGCGDAVLADLAWDGSYLYLACVDSVGALSLQRASLADLSSVAFEAVATSVAGAVDALDLEGPAPEGSAAGSTGVALAVRQGTAVRVYADARDPDPAFDEAALPGDFDLASTARGPVLTVCDSAGDHTLRTFVVP